MPSNLKWVGIYGNGALAAGAGLIAFGSIINGEIIPILIGLAVCALSVYNIRVIRWATSLDPEEEYLEAEVRKADLRHHLAELGEFAHPPDAAPSADAEEDRAAPSSTRLLSSQSGWPKYRPRWQMAVERAGRKAGSGRRGKSNSASHETIMLKLTSGALVDGDNWVMALTEHLS